MNGSLFVKSRLGLGSTFTLVLKTKKCSDQSQALPSVSVLSN